MAKRVAGRELTDRNWDEEEEPEEAGVFTQASNKIIAGRQIRKAKRRGAPEGDGEGTGSTVFKGFSGFKGFGSTTTSTSTTETKAPAFSFGVTSKPLTGLVSNGVTAAKAPSSEIKIAPFVVGGKSTITPSPKTGDKDSTLNTNNSGNDKSKNKAKYLQQLKTLNESVSKWIKEHVDKSPFIILSPIFKDYEKHLAELEAKYPDHGTEDADKSAPGKTELKLDTPKSELSKESTTEVASSGGFSFKLSESKDTEPSGALPKFSFGASAGSTGGFGFSSTSSNSSGAGGLAPFSFAVKPVAPSSQSDQKAGNENDEDYVPPKAEVKEISEDDSLYSKRCKLFYQKDGQWTEKGVGNLHLKPLDDKTQLLIRADTNLGNILLNIKLQKSMPCQRQGKNNVTLLCIPNPPLDPTADPKPVMMLIRVKTGDDADQLCEKINDNK